MAANNFTNLEIIINNYIIMFSNHFIMNMVIFIHYINFNNNFEDYY